MPSLVDLFVAIKGDNTSYKQALRESREETALFVEAAEAAGVKIATSLSLVGIGIAAIEAGEKFEQAGIMIQRSTGATGDRLEQMEETFKALYVTSAASSENIVAAMTQISQKTGTAGEELESLTRSALRFAKVTGADLKTSVEENEKVFLQFGITAEQQATALDVLYVAQQKTGISSEKLSASLLEMGPALKNFNFKLPEAVALVGSFEKAGLSATDITMGLSKAFTVLSKSGEDPKQALIELIEKMSNAETRADALNMSIDIFGAKAAGKMVNAVQSGALSFKDLLELLLKAQGAVDETAGKTGTLSQAWTELGRSMSALLSGPGKAVIGTLTQATQAMADLSAGIQLGTFKWEDYWAAAKGTLTGGVGGAAQAFAESAANRNAAKPKEAPAKPSDLGSGSGGDGAGAATVALATDKYKGFKELSDSLATIVAQENLEIAAHKSVIEETAKFNEVTGASVEPLDLVAIKTALATEALGQFGERAGVDIPRTTEDFIDFGKGTDQASKGVAKVGDALTSLLQEQLVAARFGQLADSAKYFGITTAAEYQRLAAVATETYNKMLATDLATTEERKQAHIKMLQAEAEAERATGEITVDQYNKRVKAIEGLQHELDVQMGKSQSDQAKAVQKLTQDIQQYTKSMFRSISTEIASDIVHWKGFGASIKSIFQKLGTDVLSMLIGGLLAPVEKAFARLITSIAEKLLPQFFAVKAASSAADVGEVAGAAAVGGAAAAASTAAIPIIGPALAMEAGMAMYAAILGTYTPLAMFEKGGNVLADMPAYLHKNEMVLPADIAIPLRGMVASASGGVISGGGGQVFQFLGSINGVTRDLVRQIFTMGFSDARRAGAAV